MARNRRIRWSAAATIPPPQHPRGRAGRIPDDHPDHPRQARAGPGVVDDQQRRIVTAAGGIGGLRLAARRHPVAAPSVLLAGLAGQLERQARLADPSRAGDERRVRKTVMATRPRACWPAQSSSRHPDVKRQPRKRLAKPKPLIMPNARLESTSLQRQGRSAPSGARPVKPAAQADSSNSAAVIAGQWHCGRSLKRRWSIRPRRGGSRRATKRSAHRAGCYAHVDRRQ